MHERVKASNPSNFNNNQLLSIIRVIMIIIAIMRKILAFTPDPLFGMTMPGVLRYG